MRSTPRALASRRTKRQRRPARRPLTQPSPPSGAWGRGLCAAQPGVYVFTLRKSWMTRRISGSAFGPFAARMFASASMPMQSGLRRYDGSVEAPRCCRCFWRQEAARSTRGPVGRGEIAEDQPAQRVRTGCAQFVDGPWMAHQRTPERSRGVCGHGCPQTAAVGVSLGDARGSWTSNSPLLARGSERNALLNAIPPSTKRQSKAGPQRPLG